MLVGKTRQHDVTGSFSHFLFTGVKKYHDFITDFLQECTIYDMYWYVY